jgi:hypothetical protein
MSVEIDPTELGFHRPFTAEVSQILKIRNPNHTPVAFKVKTTAPKQYCVRPNSGRIEPGKEVEVTVLLQAMKQEPPLDAKCRDKFLVQSVAVTADKEFTNIGSIWQHVDDAEKSSVMEKKIRVVYLAPQEGSGSAAAASAGSASNTPVKNGVNGFSNGTHDTPGTVPPPAYSNDRTPSPEQAFTPDTRRISVRHEENSPNEKSVPAALASNVAAAVPLSYDEMKAKLAEAQATIASYAEQGGVRLRKAAEGKTSSETVNAIAHQVQAGPSGVPLQIVAGLCLISFLLAYFFF